MAFEIYLIELVATVLINVKMTVSFPQVTLKPFYKLTIF